MKKLMLSAVAIVAMCSVSLAQEHGEKKEKAVNVPTAVTAAFAKQFGPTDADWEKEGANYEAEFERNKKETSAVFSADGKLLETEVEIPVAELPAAAMEYIKKNHAGATVKEAAKITDAAGVVSYEAEIKGKDLIFDAKGNFVK